MTRLPATGLAIAIALAAPAALAVEEEFAPPPTPTDTTKGCEDGEIRDTGTGECVAPADSRLDDDARYRAAREYAHAGEHAAALAALAAMSDPGDDRVLTYKGFVHRRAGRAALGFAYYRRALARNPDNLLARSYLGQGLIDTGRRELARVQLSEIRRRGGRGTWAEFALRQALEDGPRRGY